MSDDGLRSEGRGPKSLSLSAPRWIWQVSFPVTSITSVPPDSTVVPCAFSSFVAIVPIEMAKFLP